MERTGLEKKQKFIIDCAYYGLLLLIAWFVCRYLIGWLMPFLLAFLIAALIQPAVYFLHRRLRINRRAAGVFAVLAAAALFGFAVGFGLSRLLQELAAVLQTLPGLIVDFTHSLHRLSGSISGYVSTLPAEISAQMLDALGRAESELTKISSLSPGVISAAWKVASGVPGLLLKCIITVVAACFISMDYLPIRSFILRQLSPTHQEWVLDLKEFFIRTIGKLLLAYLTLMCVTFVELSVGLTVLRVPHSVMVALLIAVVDILPVLGTGTVMIPWAAIELITGNYTFALCLAILYAVITVVRNILEPKLVGYHLGLHPLVTLIAMFVGLTSVGIVGMFLFPILLIIVKHLQDTGRIRLWKG